MEEDTSIVTMDIRGQICPSCLLLALQEVNRNIQALRRHECEIRILSDDRHAMVTIPEAIAKMGLMTRVVKAEHGFELRIYREQ